MRSMLWRSLPVPVAAFAALVLWSASAQPLAAPPVTPATPVVNTYFGTRVVDPYRWMENMRHPSFRTWAKAQADHANAVLARIPGRERLKARLTELGDAAEDISRLESVAGKLFYLKSEPGHDVRRLFVRDAKSGAEHLLLDPDALAAGDAYHAIDFFTPSPNGALVAIGISQGGSEDSTLRLMEVASGAWLPDTIGRTGLNERVHWRPDSRSFFYNRLPAPDRNGKRERYNKSAVYEHLIGQPVALDKAVFGYGVTVRRHFAVPDLPYVLTSTDSAYALAVVLHGDAVDRSFYIAPLSAVDGPNTPWRRIVGPQDQVHKAYLHGNEVYLLSHRNAPRYRLLRMALATPNIAKAKTVLPAGAAVLRGAVVARDALYVRMLDGGVSRLQRLPYNGKPAVPVALPFAGTIREIAADPAAPGAMIKFESWTEAPRLLAVDGMTGQVSNSGLLKPSPLSFADIETTRVLVTSHDGVMVPLSLIHRKGMARDGNNPAILFGYGAYGISMEPRFLPARLAWLERGGIIAVAHVRGGGEFGEEWHMAGHIQTKSNTIRDFIACAEYLVRERYTAPQRLAGVGGSAGGITIGGAITQRPDLFAAAHSAVGVSDMLRMELTPNGPANIAEFGTVTKQDHFRAMYAISPYHRVQDGVAYPAVILTTGINDPRVDAWEPAKFAARLQAATASGKPVILRIDYDAGHGIGSTKTQSIAETADVWSFFLWQMGDAEFQPE